MAEGETQLLTMLETLLDRKLGDIVARVISTQVSGLFSGLRDDIAALKLEVITTAAANAQQQAECQASINALQSLIPGSQPSTQSSGTTLSAAAELRSQPIADADFAAYCNPCRPSSGDDNFDVDVMGGWSDSDEWLHQSNPHGLQQQQSAPMVCTTAHTPSTPYWNDPNAPAMHRQHNPKSCMVCRGCFVKLSSCKEHMLKCLKANSGCRFLPNCDHHQQLIRPFSGPTVEARWMSAVSEWLHRKA